MTRKILLLACMALPLAACEEFETASGSPSNNFLNPVPESVQAMAAPYQDLSAVRVEPASGCFVYRHVGPVETTFLPLRTRDGRPICTQKPEEEAPAT
ncbi:hypothetical protein DC366_10055 [Pelagivirga sediminicola]|uniref:Lipoprotein n=1 Tax=Pelagivirga sediminicola TaxID=2170575 RepID=A0A2T7G6E2_9RHOB|nr:hypothetical protein [Pelagivirga sediminicola]PVA10002.1 hypothetical protein DC366_10055 [Pelagivirga sediminicola]